MPFWKKKVCFIQLALRLERGEPQWCVNRCRRCYRVCDSRHCLFKNLLAINNLISKAKRWYRPCHREFDFKPGHKISCPCLMRLFPLFSPSHLIMGMQIYSVNCLGCIVICAVVFKFGIDVWSQWCREKLGRKLFRTRRCNWFCAAQHTLVFFCLSTGCRHVASPGCSWQLLRHNVRWNWEHVDHSQSGYKHKEQPFSPCEIKRFLFCYYC